MIYEVWAESYWVSGNRAGPQLLGTASAESFEEACDIVGTRPEWVAVYDRANRRSWGRRLYPSMEDAYKFGLQVTDAEGNPLPAVRGPLKAVD